MRHLTGWPVAAWCVATAICLGGSRAAGGQPGGRQAESAADREIVTLSLDDALGREKALVACLECERGRVARALAVSPAFNTSSHDVDASAIVLADGKVRGELKVTVRPDLWNPKDRQPLACRFTASTVGRVARHRSRAPSPGGAGPLGRFPTRPALSWCSSRA
jgi:hypothetical protein